MNTGWPLTTSSPKLRMYLGSILQAALKSLAKGWTSLQGRGSKEGGWEEARQTSAF